MTASEIEKFCQDYLNTRDLFDFCHNGLQVQGKEEVGKIVGGVSFSAMLVQKAIEEKADMIIVHHGIFRVHLGDPPVVKGFLRERLALLLKHDISLLGFHLPLDAHPEIGNNISLCRMLGLKKPEEMSIGFAGDLPQAMPFAEFLELVEDKLGVKPRAWPAGPQTVKRIGVISGGSSTDCNLAQEAGCDVFVTGDMREHIFWEAGEMGINIIDAGHYNTEKEGVRNLGRLIAEKFGVHFKFIDLGCEI